MPTYYKFLNKGRIAPYSDWKWPQLKRWTQPIEGKLKECKTGYHLTTAAHLIDWIAPELYIAGAEGDIIVNGNKIVCRKARLVERVDTWNDKTARLFAAECGYHVLPIFEKRYPNDNRPRKALEMAVDFANDEAIGKDLAAAGAAARAAAQAAARDAAWAAAWAAARAAAWAAEMEWQSQRLVELLRLEGQI